MKEIINEIKPRHILELRCKDCDTRFRTDEWHSRVELSPGFAVYSDCPSCKEGKMFEVIEAEKLKKQFIDYVKSGRDRRFEI